MTSPEPLVLTSASDIRAALDDERLVPPPAAGSGSAMRLRTEMARFSAPSDHGPRRAVVEAAVASIELTAAAELASHFTLATLEQARRDGAPVEVIDALGRPVPVKTLATCFGVADGELDDVVGDVDAMVAEIGRGEAHSSRADDAVDRLSARFAAHALGRVAVLSALYQSMDATAGLVAASLIARETDLPSPMPVPRTKRVAVATADVGGTTVAAGTHVDLEIGAADLWFGAGPHACPGRALAETIVAAIVETIVESGAVLDHATVELDADRRPLAAWLTFAPPA